ncbi:hypothetical protein ACJ73_07137 [Blastomyces percursus]|uniref:Uncharacterized protein n=1 Tax=Blastomyces percursus TaxID=1658174 RepID=A0A1J9PYW6_9EURO|nr:hypothetical protein ACJ73_07137 [Blastomyces percursus]
MSHHNGDKDTFLPIRPQKLTLRTANKEWPRKSLQKRKRVHRKKTRRGDLLLRTTAPLPLVELQHPTGQRQYPHPSSGPLKFQKAEDDQNPEENWQTLNEMN